MSESEGTLKEVVAPPWSRESAVERLPVSLPRMRMRAGWRIAWRICVRLKAPSEPQRLLMMLAEKPDRSPADDRHLAVLVRAEKADERFASVAGLGREGGVRGEGGGPQGP
jgi:hypothetical protein